jgi:hypothetical protein
MVSFSAIVVVGCRKSVHCNGIPESHEIILDIERLILPHQAAFPFNMSLFVLTPSEQAREGTLDVLFAQRILEQRVYFPHMVS